MYPPNGDLPSPLNTKEDLANLDTLALQGDIHETPHNVFIGHNLGHRVFTMSVPFRKFFEISDVANDREAGPVAQRPLDNNHAKKLAIYMLKGLVSAAMIRRQIQGKPKILSFEKILKALGEQPYFSLQPIVCNIRNISPGGEGPNGVRGLRLQTQAGETAAFKIFLSERHILWVVDGQHRRKAADMVLGFLDQARSTGRYAAKSPVLYPDKGREISEDEMTVWNEAYEAARAYATITIEVHLGLTVEQEKQLFHDLNNLGKKVDRSLALQFDSSNPVTHFIKEVLVKDLLIDLADRESKDWSEDTGALPLKDAVAINAIAFLNKGNISGATPAVIEPRQEPVQRLWETILEIPHFGREGAKENTVVAQPVVLKALAKLTFDLKFSNRKPENGDVLFDKLLRAVPKIDFSHSNPVWRYYELGLDEKQAMGISGLSEFLPSDEGGNRDIGSHQNGVMRFGAKHNDIFPIVGDMIRWQAQLPNRHSSGDVALDEVA